MTALQYLKEIPFLPPSNEGLPHRPSNSELRRWLEKSSVEINGVYPKPQDEIEFPIVSLVFNAKSKRRCTMVYG